MLDGIMLVTMIVCFEVATTRFVDQVVAEGQIENIKLLGSPLVTLYVTAGYFFLRELIQVIASLALSAFGSWLYDPTNWLDVLVIALVTYYTSAMTLMDPQEFKNEMHDYDDLGGFRTGTALTKGILWMAVVFFLKSTQVDFAVFLNGVYYVVRRLVAFLLAILVILISFAQMFWLVYYEQPVCKFSCREGDYQCEAEMEGCNYPHCEFGDSFLKVSIRIHLSIIHHPVCVLPVERQNSHTHPINAFQFLGLHNDDGRNWNRDTLRSELGRPNPLHLLRIFHCDSSEQRFDCHCHGLVRNCTE